MKIGVLTSGGDAPGMNAAIRAVVRTAAVYGIEVMGISRGYEGLIDDEITLMNSLDVANIISRGGTILKTARSERFMHEEYQKKAAANLRRRGIDGLVIIGGDGSFRGGLALSRLGISIACVPATIDMDMDCTDYTIGFDTAINTAMEAIDKIRDTSSSHQRAAIIEVMGRHAGYIAIYCGIANGVEDVLIPETFDGDTEAIINHIDGNRKKGKLLNMIIVAEGVGKSDELARTITERTGIEARVTVLGHIQRGGSPTCKDRVYASVMGSKAVDLLHDGRTNRVVVYKDGVFKDFDVEDAFAMKKTIPNDFLVLGRKLIR